MSLDTQTKLCTPGHCQHKALKNAWPLLFFGLFQSHLLPCLLWLPCPQPGLFQSQTVSYIANTCKLKQKCCRMVSSSARQQAFKTSNMTVKKNKRKIKRKIKPQIKRKIKRKTKKQEFSILIFPVFWKIKKKLGFILILIKKRCSG